MTSTIAATVLLLALVPCVFTRPLTHEKPMDIIIVDSKIPVTIANDVVKKQKEIKFKGSAIPNQFQLYDSNHDRKVSLEELADATETKVEDARQPFVAADLNSDTYLSLEEFTSAPWIFEAEGVTMQSDTREQ